ncbi:methylenetetrahydrofolate reductase C-terminal domain-containing protein [Benzoatithermus flavus]|uniref:Methylenetetrahydrofolate reductase C-terminal domain-containing protein n=1 Tax=Benzoatithermus flavus TaxID=3108223 RepID=A0ABU8XTD1_9PROT
MYAVRLWSVRHARFWEWFYQHFEWAYVAAGPILRKIGYDRLEKPVAVVERNVKGFLFDCQMCGQCILSSTGMSCPMNCPKQMRNGPCGGVRPNGHCEVKPEMRCVWVQAWEGSRRMEGGDRITVLQPPVDNRKRGSSAWLRIVREHEKTGEAA